MTKIEMFAIILFCFKFIQTIYMHSAGHPYEYIDPNSIADEEDVIDAYTQGSEHVQKYQYPSYTENYIYPYGNVDKDYGVLNMSFLASQLQNSFKDVADKQKNMKKTKNRVGFYNVQTGDEFFLNDFEVRPKFKTKQSNKQVLGYEYIANGSNDRNDQVSTQKTTTTKKPKATDNPRYGMNTQQRPQQSNNRRKNNNKTTNKRRRPTLQNTKKPPNRNTVRKPAVNSNKNTAQKNTNNNRKNTLQNNRKKPQGQNVHNTNGCRYPNNPLKNPNSNRRPSMNNNRNTNNNRNKLNNQNRKPVRKVNNNKQSNNVKNNNRRKLQNGIRRKGTTNQNVNTLKSRDSSSISEVIKKYISKLKSNAFENSIRKNVKALNGRQRSLFSVALNQIGSQSMNFANRFLNFFNVVQYPNYQCIADSDFNYYEGICYQEKQCLKLGGTPLGNCSSYDTCCVFKATCGDTTNQNCTYFESPSYPHYFPNNDTQSPDLFLDDSEYELEETTEGTPLEYDYGTGNSIIDEEISTISTSFEDSTEDAVVPTEQNVGDEFFMETESLSDMPLMEDEENNQDTTEEPFMEDFEITETIGWLQQNRYKEYALARQDYLAENFACTFKVFKTSEKIQQMKIDFIDLELLGPNENGDCVNERLMITGQNLNTHIPTICGYNSGQHANRRVSIGEVVSSLNISHGSAYQIIHDELKFRKVCARWVPRMLTAENKTKRLDICQRLLDRFNAEGDAVLSRIVTDVERRCNLTYVYVDVSTLSGPLQISILSNDVYAKRYKLRICQLETPCVNSMNCLQYYTGSEGVISSLNYDQAARFPRSEPQYLNNLNYAICIRREAGYCSTTFTNVDEENVEYPFDIRSESNVSVSGSTNTEFSMGHVDCPDDYIVINNMRICGQVFQSITETGTGSIIIIPVHTNHQSTGMGFKLLYTQNECLI